MKIINKFFKFLTKIGLRFTKRMFGIEFVNKFFLISPDMIFNAEILRMFGAKVGYNNVRLTSPITIYNNTKDYSNLEIGDGVVINPNCLIDLTEKVILEKGVSLGPNVSIVTHNYFNSNPFLEKSLEHQCGKGPVVIKEGSGIKVGAKILKGVTIGKNSVVAAGAVVTKDVPDHHIVMGIPAKSTYDILNQKRLDLKNDK